MDYQAWFSSVTGEAAYPWQTDLAAEPSCQNRLIRIPTGFGKTLGVVSAWAHHRCVAHDDAWPRRLVWVLPMRVLAEQTEAAARGFLEKAKLLRNAGDDPGKKVGVHVLMGGSDAGAWHLYPEAYAILIGTQDMLLSRALNRGYAAPRARWPMECGLLNHDSLWVTDEVQLMDTGLATSAQLQAFREQDREKALRPCHTWWMSATLRREWLDSVDTLPVLTGLPTTSIPPAQWQGHLWDDVKKPCQMVPTEGAAFASLVAESFRTYGKDKLTLVVANTVKQARAIHQQLLKDLKSDLPAAQIHLVHSRFRPAERQRWRAEFLRRDAPLPPGGRIIIATQVVEAGVDLDASLLVTELAPWSSLIQRFGRAARGGGEAHIIVADTGAKEAKKTLPYDPASIAAARDILPTLADVSPKSLERFEETLDAEARARLYPYEPAHLLLRHEWEELFDTTPDLTGADIDISRFIRSGEENDLQVFWANIPAGEEPPTKLQPSRESLCAVPFLDARDWLCGKGATRLKEAMRAWCWDWLDGVWKKADSAAMLPGRVLLVDAACGGYDTERGWDRDSKTPVAPVAAPDLIQADERADDAQDGEDLSVSGWKTIATHGLETARAVGAMAAEVAPRMEKILALAAQVHDLGKAHPAFQGSMRHPQRPLGSDGAARTDLAKAPDAAWKKEYRYRDAGGQDHRPAFRHELASALGLFALMRRHAPRHPALLGPWGDILKTTNSVTPEEHGLPIESTIARDILALDAGDFDLLVYLVASHHGKTRMGLCAAPQDQDYQDLDGRGLPIRGVREGDILPGVSVTPGDVALPELTLSLEPAMAGLSCLTGASWCERTAALLERHGPAMVGFLEACLRAADIRASCLATSDPRIEEGAS